MLARKCHLNVGNGIWKVQCDWLSMGQECGLRLSRRLWGGMRNDLPEKRLRGRLVSSPNGTKITVQSPALYKLRQWMKTKFFIQAQWKSLWLKQQFMKSDQKCNCNVSNACLCLQRSVLIQPCDLRLITTENVDVKCAAFELVNMRSGKNCLRLDLLDCEDILLCCSGGTDLVFFGLSGCTWLTIQDSRHFSLSLQRCWMVAVEAFQIFVTA